MTARSEFIAELTRDIVRDTAEKRWQSIKADLNALAEQLVDALVNRRDDVVTKAYEAVERGYSEIVTKFELDDQSFDAATTAAELRGLTRFLGTALQLRRTPKAAEVALSGTHRPLLEALFSAPAGMSGRELAKQLKVEPETVARKLPVLRSLKLVQSQQVGKNMINRLTAEARTLLAETHTNRTRLDEVKVIASRTANVVGTTVNVGKYVPLGRRSHKHPGGTVLTIKHGNVPAGKRMLVEIVGTGSERGAHHLSNMILNDTMVAQLAQLNSAAREEGVDHFSIDVYPSNQRVIANLATESEDEAAY